MKTLLTTIVLAAVCSTAFAVPVSRLDARSTSPHARAVTNALIDQRTEFLTNATPEQLAEYHKNTVQQKAREDYQTWSSTLARADKITQTNAKRQAAKIVKASGMFGEDADTYAAEFVRMAPVIK